MAGRNSLIIMSDEHAFDVLGCYGHPLVRTPHLDELAKRGCRFTNAYTPSPMCVPTRASIATGRYPHETGYWDSATPYDGRVPSWGHALKQSGRSVVSVGKLHFRSTADDNGFTEELLPMHVVDGIGWPHALKRDVLPDFDTHAAELARDAGAGETTYTRYDRDICERACRWLEEEAASTGGPWTLFVSFVAPHYPLRAPEEFFRLYADAELPPLRDPEGSAPHKGLDEIRDFYSYNRHFTEETTRLARQAYFGLVSFLDCHIGRVIESLERCGQIEDTVILYTSDHGELLGNHGMWTKQCMYEESAGVPLIMAGSGVPAGTVCEAPVSLIDLYPTALEVAGLEAPAGGPSHGRSLLETIANPPADRTVYSEYHDGGSTAGFYMVRWDRWKYVHYVGAPPQLFDLEADPHELSNLASDPAHANVLQDGERRLLALLDPEATNARALHDQSARIAELGGEEALAKLAAFNHTPVPNA